MTRVASFDVFDTVLIRTVGSPRQVFVETGRRLLAAGVIGIDAQAFAAAREQAGWDLTPDRGRHPSLDHIAGELAARLGLPAERRHQLAAAELDVERAVCRALPGSRTRVQEQRSATGRGVVFVSDTPFAANSLRESLVREGLFETGDRVYTSSEAGASKQDGGLFDVVAGDLGVPAAELHHVGDDRWSDLAHARLHGWAAELDTRAHFTVHEQRLDDQAVATDGLGPRLASAGRTGRLQAAADGIDPGLAGIATAVALPLLAGFGLWVLGQARMLELDRLYFVARDGEVFREITRRLAEHAGDRVECRYLHGSRASWRLASTGTTTFDHDGMWVPDEVTAEDLSARDVLTLVDLTPDDAHALTGSPEFAAARADNPLGAEGWSAVTQALRADPLAGEIRRRARSRRDLLLRYLDQEGVTRPGRVGLVDVGWTGRAARFLEDVIDDAGLPAPTAHLFLGLRDTAPALMGPDLFGRSHGWLLDEARGRGVRSGAEDPVMLIESFAMGTEGHTTGFAVLDDHVVPQLAAPRNLAFRQWPLADYRRALLHALDGLLDGPALDVGIDLRPLAWRQLLGFWRHPTRSEAAAWGAQPYGEDFGNARTHPLATPVTPRRLLVRLGVGRAAWRQPTYWLPGTIALSPQLWRHLLSTVDRLERTLRRLRRVPVRLRGELALRRGR